MKKVIAAILIGIVIIAGGYYFLSQKKEDKQLAEHPIPKVMPTPVLATWDDPAAFTFQYPKELTLNNHPENSKDYAQVELKSDEHRGGIVIWVKDTTAKSIENYLSLNKIETSLDTNLGDISAKKYTDLKDSTIIHIVSIQFGYLYQIDVVSSDNFWNSVSAQVINSFKFKEPTPTVSNSSEEEESAPAEDYGGDEVIE